MKRSEMLKVIEKVCKNWENSKVTIQMAEEILIAIEIKIELEENENFNWEKENAKIQS